jgi:hypothetical protein
LLSRSIAILGCAAVFVAVAATVAKSKSSDRRIVGSLRSITITITITITKGGEGDQARVW